MLVTLFGQVAIDTVHVIPEAVEARFREAKEEVTEFQAIRIATLAEGKLAVECLIYNCHNNSWDILFILSPKVFILREMHNRHKKVKSPVPVTYKKVKASPHGEAFI